MKKILMISLLFSLTVGFVACDDNKDEYLSDYSTIVYFRNSGEIPLTLYKTGEDTEYQLTVNKSGSDLASVTDVEVAVLDDAALDAYNAQNGTSYVRQITGWCSVRTIYIKWRTLFLRRILFTTCRLVRSMCYPFLW